MITRKSKVTVELSQEEKENLKKAYSIINELISVLSENKSEIVRGVMCKDDLVTMNGNLLELIENSKNLELV